MKRSWQLAVDDWQKPPANCQLPTANFVPAWFLKNPHAQTVWGRIARPRQLVSLRREVLVTPDDDDLVLDHLECGRPARTPIHFLLLHGLEGSSYSVYMQGLLAAIARRGLAATVMNFRSCAREPGNTSRMLLDCS